MHHVLKDAGVVSALATACLLGMMGVEHHIAASAASQMEVKVGIVQPKTAELTLAKTLVSGFVMLLIAGLSWYLRLGITSAVLVSYVRCAGQLAALGFILTPVLTTTSPLLVLLVMLTMLSVASIEVVARIKHTFPHVTLVAFTALGVGVGLNLVTMLLFLEVDPIWSPLYAIPVWGMTLGNSLTAVTLALGGTTEALAGDGLRDVEGLLCHGGTTWEASQPMVVEAMKRGLVPTINQMNVIGLVFLPGMVTGQLLGGASAQQACYYQMMIMFMIAGSCFIAVLLSMFCTMRILTDSQLRIRTELLTSHQTSGDLLVRSGKALGSAVERYGMAPMFLMTFAAVIVVCFCIPLWHSRCATQRPHRLPASSPCWGFTQVTSSSPL